MERRERRRDERRGGGVGRKEKRERMGQRERVSEKTEIIKAVWGP